MPLPCFDKLRESCKKYRRTFADGEEVCFTRVLECVAEALFAIGCCVDPSLPRESKCVLELVWCGVLCCGVVACLLCCVINFDFHSSPRLLKFLTTLTLGAQRRNHIVSTALETIAKKKTQRQ